MTSEFKDLHTVDIPKEWLSRGTGEQIPLQEATVFDFMPQLIGSRFSSVEGLRRGVHFYGERMGPFLALEEAYTELATEELKRGNLEEALEGYKRALHSAVGFIGAMAMIQDHALLSSAEVDRLNLGMRFGDLERKLIDAIVQQEVAFDPNSYADFVREVRTLEKQSRQLNQLFFFGESKAYEHITAPARKDPDVGRQYIDTCLRMGQFSQAAWIASKLGNPEGEAKYKEQAENEPKDNPRFDPIFERVLRSFDRD